MLRWAVCGLLLAVGLAGPTPAPTTGFPSKMPTVGAPTDAPTPFTPPTLEQLQARKSTAAYPNCRAELLFAVDVSGSVSAANQKILFTFVDEMVVAVESNIKEGRYGVVVFGINNKQQNSKWYTNAPGPGRLQIPKPWGDNVVQGGATEVLLKLDTLKYDCAECKQQNGVNLPANWSQLNVLYDVGYDGDLTPTWTALDMVYNEYNTSGDPTIPGRFIILLTDGIPNFGGCNQLSNPNCTYSVNFTNTSIARVKQGALLLTVFVGDGADTEALVHDWASEPRELLALTPDYATLVDLIPQLLAILCPQAVGSPCLAKESTYVDIVGSGFLDTGLIRCRFFRIGEAFNSNHETPGEFIRDDVIRCPLPDKDTFFPGEWQVNFTENGATYNEGPHFKYGTVCEPELLVIWWPFCALALLPLAFCRPARTAPAQTTKVTRGVARPAPAATEEYEEYEEVEEIVAPPPPVNKWKVAPTAYIGFGRARLSVDWAGVAPESAPHEGVRKKVVKKVVSDTAPVPVAGPAMVPQPVEEAPQTTTTHTSRPPIVEEPDWVNSFMDKIAAVFCCCCVKKK